MTTFLRCWINLQSIKKYQHNVKLNFSFSIFQDIVKRQAMEKQESTKVKGKRRFFHKAKNTAPKEPTTDKYAPHATPESFRDLPKK